MSAMDPLSSKQARCPLPGCDAGLAILLSQGGIVYEDGTIDPDISSTWSVGCEQGHVVLLPPDTAQDYYEWDERAAAMVRDLTAWKLLSVQVAPSSGGKGGATLAGGLAPGPAPD